MKKLNISILFTILFFVNLFVSMASTKQDIEKANKKGQIVFLAVTEKGNSQNQEALNIAKKAQKLYSKSSALELDRTNTANRDLVQKYRLAGAPMPLVLVISRNGFVAGGAPIQNLTAEELIIMVPTLKEEGIIKAINEGNSVFVVFSKKSDSKNKKQMDVCQSACSSMGDKAKIINVDIEDKNEKTLISKFNIDKSTEFPITYVINETGQITSMMNGITEAKSLVDAANKKASSGCCPPGGGKSCGPTK